MANTGHLGGAAGELSGARESRVRLGERRNNTETQDALEMSTAQEAITEASNAKHSGPAQPMPHENMAFRFSLTRWMQEVQ